MKKYKFIIFVYFIFIYKIIRCEIINENNENLCSVNNTIFYYMEGINKILNSNDSIKNNFKFSNTNVKFINQEEKIILSKKCHENLNLIHHKPFQKPFKTIKINNEKKSEPIIISMSGNKEKIDTVYITVESLLNQTVEATNIILTLSIDEFPMKEKELPEIIIKLIKTYSNFKIKWIKENIKEYKQITVVDDYPKDVIIIINENIKYPEWFINEIYNEYVQYGRQCAIKYTSSKENDYSIDIYAFLLKKEFMGNYYEEIIKEIINIYPINQYIVNISYIFAIYLNGYRIHCNNKLEILPYNFTNHANNKIFDIDNNDKLNEFKKSHSTLIEYVYKKYKISYYEMLDAPIIVTMTTYPAREESIVKMLKHFRRQTLKPDLITLWLSETEYPKDIIPSHLKPFVDEGYIELHWTSTNSYGSKRFEVQKLYNNAYVITVDDDFYYPETYIETIYINMILTNMICIYNSHYDDYESFKFSIKFDGINDSLYVHIYAGLAGFPPYTFPIQIFNTKSLEIRDKYYKTNEEIWILSGLLSNNDKIHSISNIFFNFKNYHIENSQNVGLKYINFKKDVIEYMTARMVLENKLVDKFKKLYPKFNIL
ncbi:hypothetical protein H8356DRAFT_1420731 [Neocallimastix lanati (nom. inval.)]|nr:hypothetical protein H8356DRAFT_1420731 [Neocallimastix sp. JGI-2020a]